MPAYPSWRKKYQAHLEEAWNPVESILTHVSPVVGSHVGPGTISVAFMAGDVE